jgi:hypothetical protein
MSSTPCSHGTLPTGRSCAQTACWSPSGRSGSSRIRRFEGSIWKCDLKEARRLNDLAPLVQAGRLTFDVFEWWVAAGTLAFPGATGEVGDRRTMPDE